MDHGLPTTALAEHVGEDAHDPDRHGRRVAGHRAVEGVGMSKRYDAALAFLDAAAPTIAPPRPDIDQDDQWPNIDPYDPVFPDDDDDEDGWDPADN